MATEGNVVNRRVKYTVQKTSSGSLMTWFGLVAAEPAVRQRRTSRCIMALGGQCMVWNQ